MHPFGCVSQKWKFNEKPFGEPLAFSRMIEWSCRKQGQAPTSSLSAVQKSMQL